MHPAPKKSSAVPLVLMGAVAGVAVLPAVFSGTDVQRNRYHSREDCSADYSEALCSPDYPVGGVYGGGGTSYYGPWYRSDFAGRNQDPNDPGAGRFYRGSSGLASTGLHAPAAVEVGSRGGFGSHGRVGARGS
jgi:uncharacterized protein YgiB involved in biofilm formation